MSAPSVPPAPPAPPACIPPLTPAATTPPPKLPALLGRVLLLLVALLVFMLALHLLRSGIASHGTALLNVLQVGTAINTLGLGWLLAYVFLSGSPVAALAVTLFAAGTLNALQTFTMITGSRLGAAFVVLIVGAIASLRQRRRAPVAVGVLAMLATAAIYIPALLPGYWLLTSGVLAQIEAYAATPLTSPFEHLLAPVVQLLTATLPDWLLLVGGILTLLAALHLFDLALPATLIERLAQHRAAALLLSPVGMFLLGGAVTAITLSVSVSLGLLIPLASKGQIQPRHMLPYILGANITTFVDTLVAALIVGGSPAFVIVLIELLSVTLLSLFVLLCCYRSFERGLLTAQVWIAARAWRFGVFVFVLILVPLMLLAV